MKCCYTGYEGCRLKGLPIGIPFKSKFFVPKSKRSEIDGDVDIFILLRLCHLQNQNVGVWNHGNNINTTDIETLGQDFLSKNLTLNVKHESESHLLDTHVGVSESGDSFCHQNDKIQPVIYCENGKIDTPKLEKEDIDTYNVNNSNDVQMGPPSFKMLFGTDILRIIDSLNSIDLLKSKEVENQEKEVKQPKGLKRRGNLNEPKIPAKHIKINKQECETGKRKSFRCKFNIKDLDSPKCVPKITEHSTLEKTDNDLKLAFEDNESYSAIPFENDRSNQPDPGTSTVESKNDEAIKHDKPRHKKVKKEKRKRKIRDGSDDSKNEDLKLDIEQLNIGIENETDNKSLHSNVIHTIRYNKKHKRKETKEEMVVKELETETFDPELNGLPLKDKIRVIKQRKKIEKEAQRIKVKLQDHPDKYRIDLMESFARKDRGKPKSECATEVLVCTVCEKFKAKSTDAMESHIESHVNGELHCDLCSYIAPFVNDLTRHKRIVHKKNVNICFECGMETNGTDGLRDHLGKVHGKPQYKCKFCLKEKGVEFAAVSKNSYRQHLREVHPEKMAACKTCSRLFANETMLKKHVELGCAGIKPSYACEKCGKTYNSQERVNDHVERVHNKVRRFQCPHCPFTAARGAGLNQHLHIHTGILWFLLTLYHNLNF